MFCGTPRVLWEERVFSSDTFTKLAVEDVESTSANKDLEKSYSKEVLFSCFTYHFLNLLDHRKHYYGTSFRTDLGTC